MNLASGSRLGPYEIVAPIAAGGMGEVYRARDPRLQREVAIKILPPLLAADPAAHDRFEREVRAVGALSHPSIIAIYDIGIAGDVAYAVMELLEGRTLREALAAAPLSARKAIELGLQLAHGMAAAHARGIVHRDLKPENLFVCSDGRLKILDFGLAYAAPAADTLAAVDVTRANTAAGTIVGTVGYMAPEQIRGMAVDARTDIFAIGAVLFEMLSGVRAFSGTTGADVMSAVLQSDPPEMRESRADVPPALDRIVRRCLEKSPEERFQSARDLAFALEAISTGTGVRMAADAATASRVRWRSVAAVIAVIAIVAIVVALLPGRSANGPAEMTPVRFTIPSPIGQPPWVAVSPDGRTIAWSAADAADNSLVLWTRRLDVADAVPLPWYGRGNAAGRAEWTADGRLIIASMTGIFVFDVATGAERRLYAATPEDLKGPLRGVSASTDVLCVGVRNILVKVAPESGRAVALTSLDAARHVWHGFPRELPDGRILYIARRKDAAGFDTIVARRDGTTAGELALPSTASRVFVDPAGAVLFAQNNTLVAQSVDWASLTVIGPPVPVAADVMIDGLGNVSASVSPSGVLAYRAAILATVQFEWVDRGGKSLGPTGPPDTFTNFDLSPDGSTIAVTRREARGNRLWMIDTVRSVAMPSETPGGPPSDPTWSPDGRLLAFRRGNVTVVRAPFGGAERTIADYAGFPDSWTSDGRYLALGRATGSSYELWAVRVDGAGREEIPLATGLPLADEARFSPDNRWVVYHAALERGAPPQVFAIPFPPTGERWQLSTSGGAQPRWRPDGREIFYLDPQGQLMSVDVASGDPRRAARPVPLFRTTLDVSSANDQYTPASDGRRFLIRRPVSGTAVDQAPVHVLVNWRRIVGLQR